MSADWSKLQNRIIFKRATGTGIELWLLWDYSQVIMATAQKGLPPRGNRKVASATGGEAGTGTELWLLWEQGEIIHAIAKKGPLPPRQPKSSFCYWRRGWDSPGEILVTCCNTVK
jgi:hypothetical protein